MTLLEEYRLLLTEINGWFIHCQNCYPEEIDCSHGCSECCRGLFDITILDAALLNSGFELLQEEVRLSVQKKAEQILMGIKSKWPEFSLPFMLNHRSEEEISILLATDNETPCVLLEDNGGCLLYDYRPMTCRLHGLPLIDVSGEVMEGEWCTKNFTDCDPLKLKGLRGEFNRLLQKEAALGRDFTEELLGRTVCELDTFIPTALLMNYKDFDWRKWITEEQIKT